MVELVLNTHCAATLHPAPMNTDLGGTTHLILSLCYDSYK